MSNPVMVSLMKHKIAAEFLDQGLGFPVLLKSVPMKGVRGEWVPDLPLNECLKRLLDEVSQFDEKPPHEQSVTIPEGYLSDTTQPFPG